MQSIRIHSFGAPAQIRHEDIQSPSPEMNEVLIRVEAASVNPLDLQLISGTMQEFMPITFPYTVGTDVAGIVERVGSSVTRFNPGDRVLGRTEPTSGNGFAQYAVLAEDHLGHMPQRMSFEQAAAMPTGAGTAWLALFDMGNLQAGQRVLIHAAAGGVGAFAVQLAKLADAHVIGTASARNHELIRELGADEVIDYQTESITERAHDVDLVLHSVRGLDVEPSLAALKPGGKLLSLVDPTAQGTNNAQAEFVFFQHDAATLDKASALFADQELQVVLDTIYPLEETRAAMEQVAGGHARGKVVISASR